MSTDLTEARRLVAEMLKQDTGDDHPQWRVIITDSESPDGIAPVCPKAQDTDGLHVIADYPGGPEDEDGVYDCCPWPQVETHSTVLASYVVALLNADLLAPARPDFFQPGHTYADPDPGTYDWQFRCDMVTTHPEDGERTALGWRHFRGEWEPIAYGEDDYDVHGFVGTTDQPEASRG